MMVEGLRALQHRGQEAWGVSLDGLGVFRLAGLVSEGAAQFRSSVAGSRHTMGIGHVRYSTVGDKENIQPLKIGDEFTIAHNGTIANYRSLMKELEYSLGPFPSDTLVAGYKLYDLLKKTGWDWPEAISMLSERASGSYCFLMQGRDGTVYGVRDPSGFRPLCVGWHEESGSYVIASESCALDVVGARLIRDVNPGELVILGDDIEFVRFAEPRRRAACTFEYAYFAHPSSVIDGVSVYKVRKRVGVLLAEKYPLRGDVVIPIPDSARPAALGYSERSGIPLEEGILKDRYSRKGSWRSFIQPTREERAEINRWMIPIKDNIEGKEVIVIDDSIVRGTSSSRIVEILRRAGAKRVSILLTFPAIMYPCYMGIDFPEQQELIAHRATREGGARGEEVGRAVARMIGADFVGYNDPETFARAIGKDIGGLCFTCATGDYSVLLEPPAYISRREMKGEE